MIWLSTYSKRVRIFLPISSAASRNVCANVAAVNRCKCSGLSSALEGTVATTNFRATRRTSRAPSDGFCKCSSTSSIVVPSKARSGQGNAVASPCTGVKRAIPPRATASRSATRCSRRSTAVRRRSGNASSTGQRNPPPAAADVEQRFRSKGMQYADHAPYARQFRSALEAMQAQACGPTFAQQSIRGFGVQLRRLATNVRASELAVIVLRQFFRR
jgi:hypothetical protein